jgi:hypothetical protein
MRPQPIVISVLRQSEFKGRYALLMVTTLQRLLFNSTMPGAGTRTGAMQLLVIDRSVRALIRALIAAVRGKLGGGQLKGVHLERGDEIRIEGDRSNVILDGEVFQAMTGDPIILTPTRPVPFLRLAS